MGRGASSVAGQAGVTRVVYANHCLVWGKDGILGSWLRAAPAIAERLDGEILYLALLPTGPILVLDAIGGLIWQEATTGPERTVIDRIVGRLGIDRTTIEKDVLTFIDDLIARGLLVQIEDGLEY